MSVLLLAGLWCGAILITIAMMAGCWTFIRSQRAMVQRFHRDVEEGWALIEKVRAGIQPGGRGR